MAAHSPPLSTIVARVPPRVRSTVAVGLTAVAVRRLQLLTRRPRDASARRVNCGVPLPAVDASGAAPLVVRNTCGVELYVRRWLAKQTPPRGTVVVIHGLGWHGAWFAPLARRLAAAGFDVVAPDLQGHGLSGRADAGLSAYAESLDVWASDAAAALRAAARPEAAAAPTFVLGESLGGAVALRAWLSKVLRPTGGLLLLGPFIRLPDGGTPPPPAVALLRALAALFPHAQLPPSDSDEAFASAFGDPALAARARADPLVARAAPRLGTAGAILGGTADNAARLGDVSPPALLVLHGDCDTRTALNGSEELVRRCRVADATMVRVAGGRHQLLQDRRQVTDSVTQHVVEWLLSHTRV